MIDRKVLCVTDEHIPMNRMFERHKHTLQKRRKHHFSFFLSFFNQSDRAVPTPVRVFC